MAAGDVLETWGSSAAFTWGSSDANLHGLANGDACSSAQVTDASPCAERLEIFASIVVASAPTSGNLIKIYIARGDDNASEHRDGGLTTASEEKTSDADVDALERTLRRVATLAMDSGQTTYQCSFTADRPGTDMQLVVVNNSGVALHASSSYVRYRAVYPNIASS